MIKYNFKKCDGNQLGTALPECFAQLGYPIGFIRVPRNLSLDSENDALDLAYMTEQIQKQDFIPFVNSVNYTENTPEPTSQEFDSGAKLVVRNGKPEFVYDYINGKLWDGVAHSYNANNRGAVILAFDNGTLLMAESNGMLSGFDLQMQNAASFKNRTGSEVAKTQITIQIQDEFGYNNNFAILTRDQLGFDVSNDLPQVMDVNLIPEDTAAGESLNVAAVATLNSGSNILGLTDANFRLVVNGAAGVISSVSFNDVTEKYVIGPTTPFAIGDVVYVELYDTAASISVANLDNQLYKGKSKEITIS
jgi:hypothetical protein